MITTIIQRAVMQGTPLLFGSTGEILTEKSGHLNLGIPGIMYVGAISGVAGSFLYELGASGEGIVTNVIYSVGQYDAGQFGTVQECVTVDADDGVGFPVVGDGGGDIDLTAVGVEAVVLVGDAHPVGIVVVVVDTAFLKGVGHCRWNGNQHGKHRKCQSCG